jgi:uncharacterized protein YlzI (FlbEa/FlbD family)
MILLELTTTTGKDITFIAENIETIEEYNGGTMITMISGSNHQVRESDIAIKKEIVRQTK